MSSGHKWIEAAENPLGHYDESPWWKISQQMNGPELRDRFNKMILPKLDSNHDGYLELEELQKPHSFSEQDADAARILTDYFSFLVEFKGGMTPGYSNVLHGETLGLYAEFEKTFTRFNSRLFELTDYVDKNFNSFDTNRDKGISWEELESKMKTGSGKEKGYAEFLRNWYHGFAGGRRTAGEGPGYTRADLSEFERRRTPHPGLLLKAEDEPQPVERENHSKSMPTPVELPIDISNVEVERPRTRRHRHYPNTPGKEPQVVPPRDFPVIGEKRGSDRAPAGAPDIDAELVEPRMGSYKGHGKKFNVEREDPPTLMERLKNNFKYYLGR